jgi:hypothetical protein
VTARGYGRRSTAAAGWLVATLGVAGCDPPPPEPAPPGTIAFAVLGDAPYTWTEERRFERLIAGLNRDSSLAFVIHVGDIFWFPCSDRMMERRREDFDRIIHPVVYTPGDNEWTDCWGRPEGRRRPLERLERLRRTFFTPASQSLGGRGLSLETQSSDSAWSEFVENRRWTYAGIVFATVHLVGSQNARDPFPSRDRTDDEASVRRTEAAAAWLAETFAAARRTDARAVFLAMHSIPEELNDLDNLYRRAFEPFLTELERQLRGFLRPVVLAHGDQHDYIVDSPLLDRETGAPFARFTRLEVMGSPEVGWVRVVVDTARTRFSFTPYRLSPWRVW